MPDASRDSAQHGGAAEPPLSILTINAGSSSLRLALFAAGTEEPLAEQRLAPAPAAEPAVLQDFLRGTGHAAPAVVVHRVVHGGSRLRSPCWIDSAVEAEIARLTTLAPLHNPVALAWIGAAQDAWAVRHLAVFDSGFFADLPSRAARYALPGGLTERFELWRYGFHGLAHRCMLEAWQQEPDASAGGRVLTVQLGSGCSMAALLEGRPVETSMGFSPLEGLMMGTRCGDLDPGALLHLLRHGNFGVDELERLLNRESGLLGVSGTTADMGALLASPGAEAALAVTMFCHRVRKYLGAFLAVLEGADAILFGGGIGETAPEVRARVLTGFTWAGIRLDPARNARIGREGGVISADDSAVRVRVVPVSEERLMAHDAMALLQAESR